MGRSIKKGPYVATHLEKKVLAINEGKNKKSVIKTFLWACFCRSFRWRSKRGANIISISVNFFL